MSLRNLIVVSLIVLTCTACGSTEKKAPTPGEVKAYASVCDKANDGKRIAVEGYLRLPEEVNRKIGPVLRLYPTPEFTGKPIGVSTEIGSQPNHIAMIPNCVRWIL
jgi:hypothetical protein